MNFLQNTYKYLWHLESTYKYLGLDDVKGTILYVQGQDIDLSNNFYFFIPQTLLKVP